MTSVVLTPSHSKTNSQQNDANPTNEVSKFNDIDNILSEIALEIDADYDNSDDNITSKQTTQSTYSLSLSFVPQQNWLTKITEVFNFERQLGFGASCRVVLAENKSNKTKYALKEMQKQSRKNKLFFAKEYQILNSLSHENILAFDSAYIDKNCYYLCVPYHSGGTMLDRILEKGSFCESECAEFMKNVLHGLKHMHDNNIAHRDIKCDNLIFDKKGKNGIVKIIDFGNSEIITNPKQIDNNIIGSMHYLPPELLLPHNRTKQMLYKGDMYALGVVCFVLVTGKVPFYGNNRAEILSSIRSGKYTWPAAEQMNISDSCKDFISQLLCMNVQKRVDCNEALKHEWISKKGQAAKTLFGNEYFNAIEIFSQRNQLEKILLNAVLSEMDTKQKHILLKAIRDLDINSENIDESNIINYVLLHGNDEMTEPEMKCDEVECILNEIDKMDYLSEEESDEGEFIFQDRQDYNIMMAVTDEKLAIEALHLNFHDFTSTPLTDCEDYYSPDPKISVKRFSAMMSGAHKKYDIQTLVDRLVPTPSGNIHLNTINRFNGPLRSIASNNAMISDVIQIGLNLSLSNH